VLRCPWAIASSLHRLCATLRHRETELTLGKAGNAESIQKIWNNGRDCKGLLTLYERSHPWKNNLHRFKLELFILKHRSSCALARLGLRAGPCSRDYFRVQAWFKWQQSNLIQNISDFLAKKTLFPVALTLCWWQAGLGNRSHRPDFLGNFRTCPLPETVRDKNLQTWHPVSSCLSSNAKNNPTDKFQSAVK
jgi:hypothetical protein